ncbi:MAG: sigma-54-dependent transcriptional regulator [Planctomycetota bacterium]
MAEAATIWVVDDEAAALRSTELVLLSEGYDAVRCFVSPLDALDALATHQPELIIADLCMPGMTGLQLLEAVLAAHPGVSVLMVTAINEAEQAVRSLKAGAVDYLVKPVDATRLITSVRNALQLRWVAAENSALRDHLIDRSLREPEAFTGLLTNSPAMHAVFAYIEAVAPGNQPVLVTGETGTGKELIACAIHRASRRQGAFVAANVAGIDSTVLADTLFGHRRGAFTGAETDRPGLVERATSGTLFLDEIGDLAPESQIKLLRLLQEREYHPLGSDEPVPTDARVVAATMRDLEALVAAGSFRQDLYYRLHQHRVHLPPLRERREDLALLLPHFAAAAAADLGLDTPHIPPEACDVLAACQLRGNVRELEALVREAVTRHRGGVLSLQVFRDAATDPTPLPDADHQLAPEDALAACPRLPPLKQIRQLLVREALRRSNGNQSLAANLLGVTRQAIARYQD